MIVIVSTHGARIPVLWMHKLTQAAVHLSAKGASNEKEFLILTHSTFNTNAEYRSDFAVLSFYLTNTHHFQNNFQFIAMNVLSMND